MRLIRRHSTALVPYHPPATDIIEGEVTPVERIRLPETQDALIAHEYRRPLRSGTVEGQVKVPGAQAGMTAFAAAICAGWLAAVFGWPILTVGGVFSVTLLVAWLWRMRIADGLLWQVETWTGRDFTGDGVRGKPQPRGTTTVVNGWQARQEAAQLQADDARSEQRQALVAFVHRCFRDGCSEQAHGIKRGSGSERAEYIRNRDTLLRLGLAVWKNPDRPSAGWRMCVNPGRAMLLIERHTL